MPQQLELLDRVPLSGAAPLVMTPREKGLEAAGACASKAELTTSFSTLGAARFMHSWVVRYGACSGEQLVKAAREHGHAPHDDRAFGMVFRMLDKGLADGKRLKVLRSDLPRSRGHNTSGGKLWGLA